jgi:hypothetical protein
VADNLLYYGDNLDILRRYVAEESALRLWRRVAMGNL